MNFRISISPDPSQWPIGDVLTLGEAAQLLEVEASRLAARGRQNSAILEQGFRLRAIPEAGEFEWRDDTSTRLGEELHEFEAIAFLRALIHQPPRLVPGLGIDSGWCSAEHAKVAQIALRAVGEDARLAIGNLAFFDYDNPKSDFQSLEHRFLLLPREELTIFDSAASFRGVPGLAPRWRDRYPRLKVLAYEGEPEEEGLTIYNDPQVTPQVACYFVHEERKLPRDVVSFFMDSPFCHWIEEQFGDQQRLWGNVIGATIRILSGEPYYVPVPLKRQNQMVLWNWLESQPDDREFIQSRLWD